MNDSHIFTLGFMKSVATKQFYIGAHLFNVAKALQSLSQERFKNQNLP